MTATLPTLFIFVHSTFFLAIIIPCVKIYMQKHNTINIQMISIVRNNYNLEFIGNVF